MASTLSFLVSPHVKVSEEDLWSLVGRDELHIEQAPASNEKQEDSSNSCLGSMTVDIERSKYRGQNCFFVNLCTNINRRGLEHSCFVSSFVGLNLDTLEERRLIVSRGSQLPSSNLGGAQKPDLYRSKSGRPLLQVVETCRSVVFVPKLLQNFGAEKDTDFEKDFGVENPSGKLIVSEWRRRNGILDDNHSAPMNVEVDLPREAGFVSDASLLLAEKILAKVGHTGKFNRIGTLDKNGWFAPISLSVVKSEGSTFRTTKSSPVEKGATETIYDESGKITTRIITTASNLKYFLQKRSSDYPVSVFAAQPVSNMDPIRKRLFEESVGNNMMKLQKFLLAPPDRCSLVDLLKDALQEVLFQRPDNPIEFLKQYFAQLKNN